MPENIIKASGPTSASKNDTGGGVLRSEPVIGIVKNNIDPVRQGRIQVFIADLNGPDPDDSSCWTTVRFMSPFYGRTYGSGGKTGFGSYVDNPISYGEWHSPPDIGTEVVCIFVNGDPNYGFYIGCIPQPELLTMVPAIGSVKTEVTMNEGEAKGLAGATQLPVTNLNLSNTSVADSDKFLDAPKPVHSYVASILSQQGLIRDTVRGTITTSSQRETPSRVGWGVSTPGRPIYEGGFTDANIADAIQNSPQSTKIIGRRAGHSFVMDDGDRFGKDQLIRLRSSLGHQILMSDNGQCLFIIHANGQSWIELGAEGTIDMYSTNSVNIRTQGDLNFHADNNINLHANKNINFKAKENFNIDVELDTSIKTGQNFKQQTKSNYTVKTDGQLSLASAGDASLASSGGSAFVNGSKVNLNTGATSLIPQDIAPLVQFVHTDTLFDSEKGFIPAPGKLQSITSRAPAHQPWINANQGVNVPTKLDASENLPTQPPPAVETVNNVVPATPEQPVTPPVVATVPNTSSAGGALNAGATSTLVSATAVAAATGPAAAAASAAGAAIVNGTPVLGQLAQTAQQMVTGGTIKPGADVLINGLTQAGASIAGAMPTNLFTSKSGSASVQEFVSSTPAQVQNMVTNITTAQQQLVQAGVMTGKESPAAVGGLILSGVQNGVAATADFVKNIGSSVSSTVSSITGSLTGIAGNIAGSISAGNFAGGLSDTLGGALGNLKSGATSLIDKGKSSLTSAFDSIKGAYKSFTPGVPQDLTAIAEKNTKELEVAQNADSALTANDALSNLGSSLTGALGAVTSGVTGAVTSVTNALGITGASAGLNNALSSVTSGISSVVSSITSGVSPGSSGSLGSSVAGVASTVVGTLSALVPNSKTLQTAQTGLQGLPGGQSALALVIDAGKSLSSVIPGASTLGSVIGDKASGLLSGAGTQLMSAASAASSLLGNVSGSLPSLTNLVSQAQSNFKPESASLSGLASSILPAALSNQLASALSSITANNPSQLQIPTVAVGTTNRSSVTSQIGSILGSSKIPPPNYGSLASFNSDYDAQIAKVNDRRKQLKDLSGKLEQQIAATKQAQKAFEDAEKSLPEGDPQLVVLNTKWKEEYATVQRLKKELIDFSVTG